MGNQERLSYLAHALLLLPYVRLSQDTTTVPLAPFYYGTTSLLDYLFPWLQQLNTTFLFRLHCLQPLI